LTVDDLRAKCVVDASTGCWNWNGALSMDGIPRIWTLDYARITKRSMSGPRAAWSIAHEADPGPGWLVFRRCGNRRCLAPVHLARARDKAEIGLHIRRAGWRVGTAVESRLANLVLARAACGIVPTSEHMVREIRAADPEETTADIARRYAISHSTVSRIRLGKSHKHVGRVATEGVV
jgi:hypothetical protein